MRSGDAAYLGCEGSAKRPEFVTDPGEEKEKVLLNCPTADGVDVTAVSILVAPGPEIGGEIKTLGKAG